MSRPIGIGFIGAGGNTELRHLPGFAALEGVELITVANRSEASSARVAQAWGLRRTAPDWRAVLDDPEVDAICIGTWPYLHAEVTVAALAAGKHVLTEARMAADLAGARAMLAAEEARPDRVAQIVPSPFTLDLDSTVLALLREQALGEIREIFVEHTTPALLDPSLPMGWRQDPQVSGINMLTLGIYHEVIERWFREPIEVLAASAAVHTPERTHWESGRRVPVVLPDCLHVLARMGDRTLLNYHFSGVESGPPRNEIRLVGASGSLRVDVGRGQLYLSDHDKAERPVEIPPAARRGWRVEADFIASIREGRPVELTSFPDGLRYMRFTDAVHARIQGR